MGAKKEYTMKQLIQILTDKSEDGTSKKTRSLINRKIFRKIIKKYEDSLVLGNKKISSPKSKRTHLLFLKMFAIRLLSPEWINRIQAR